MRHWPAFYILTSLFFSLLDHHSSYSSVLYYFQLSSMYISSSLLHHAKSLPFLFIFISLLYYIVWVRCVDSGKSWSRTVPCNSQQPDDNSLTVSWSFSSRLLHKIFLFSSLPFCTSTSAPPVRLTNKLCPLAFAPCILSHLRFRFSLFLLTHLPLFNVCSYRPVVSPILIPYVAQTASRP